MTRLEMAQLIVQALYKLPELPPADNRSVKRWSKIRKADLEKISLKSEKLIGGKDGN